MGERFESDRATVILRNDKLALAAASPLLLMLASIVAGVVVSPRLFGATILSFILGSLLSGLVFLVNPFPKRDGSGITANPQGLTTRDGVTISRESLREGMVVPGAPGHIVVRLWRKGLRLPVEVAVPSLAEGAALLEALRLDPGHSVASFFGMSRVYATLGAFVVNTATFFLGPLFLAVGASWLHAPALGTMALLVGALAYVSFFMPMRLRIGQDGLIVSWYGRKRFISYADVDAAEESGTAFTLSSIRGVVIRLSSGEQVMVPLSYGFWGQGHPAIAAERIREAMEAYARGGEGAEAAMLARGERTASEWILALRQIGAGANAGPRTAAMATDTLWRIVESAASRPSVRAAAAVALAPGLDETERARLRSVAEGTTTPKLRIAIESSTAEDDAAIAEALGELEADERAISA